MVLYQRFYRYAISGENAEGTPFQLVYGTTDVSPFHDVKRALEEQSTRPDDIAAVEDFIQSKFPTFSLLKRQTGGNIEVIRPLEDFLPPQHTSSLLKRTLLQKHDAIKNASRRAGNEFFSSLPTLWSVATRGEAGYIVAAVCSLAIVGMIAREGSHEQQELDQALQIWLDYEKIKRENDPESYIKLQTMMEEHPLLFSDVPDFYRAGDFDPATFAQMARERGLFQDKDTPRSSGWERVKHVFHVVNHSPEHVAGFLKQQGQDLCTNLFNREAYQSIWDGFLALPEFAKDFHRASCHKRHVKKTLKQSLTHDSPGDESASFYITGAVTFIDDILTEHHASTVKNTRIEKARIQHDAKLMGGAYALEALFTLAHLHEMKDICGSAMHNLTDIFMNQADINEDSTQLLIGVYSLAMTVGAWSHVGEQFSHAVRALHSRQAQIVQHYESILEKITPPLTPEA